MSHEIFGERFFGYRQPGWHLLGNVYTDLVDTIEAFKRSRLNYTVLKLPIRVESPWGEVDPNAQGKPTFALVREPVDDDPQARFFATCGEKYTVIQNEEIARVLQPLSTQWPVETAGALGAGERIFVCLRIGSADIKGDEVKEYLLVNEAKDASNKLNLAIVHTRVVCANTLAVALNEGSVIALKHEGELAAQLGHEVGLMAQIRAAQSDQLLTIEQLSERVIGDTEAASIFRAAYPDKAQPRNRLADRPLDTFSKATIDFEQRAYQPRYGRWMQETARQGEFRDACMILYHKINEEYPRIARTAWAAVNAVTELADHAPIGSKPDGEKLAAESSLFGLRKVAKANAYARAVSLVK
jgi:phage/plasmid-like protein (TIGR03299 family)